MTIYLYLLNVSLVFSFLCVFVFVFCTSWDEVEGERAPIIPIDVLHKLQKRFTVSFPRPRFQFLQTLHSASLPKQIIKQCKYTNMQIQIHKKNIQTYMCINTNTQKNKHKNVFHLDKEESICYDTFFMKFHAIVKGERQISICVPDFSTNQKLFAKPTTFNCCSHQKCPNRLTLQILLDKVTQNTDSWSLNQTGQ